MISSPPIETRMKLTDTKQQLSQVVNRVARGEAQVVVEKSGLPVAAIISAQDYRHFLDAESQREARFEAIGRISDAFADVPVDELERQVERAVAETRARRRAEERDRGKLQENEPARRTLHEALCRISDAFKDVPDEEPERELAKAQAEVRAAMRAEREAAARG